MPDEKYYRTLLSGLMTVTGAFLLLEHIVVWGGADIDDPIGHENYALWLLIGAYMVSARWKGKYVLRRWRDYGG